LPKVVCNSSPLIHLSKAGRLSLLRDFFQEILVPEEVLMESVENSGGAEDAKEIENAGWIHPMAIEDMDLKKALKLTIDEGEAAAIVLALEQKADLVIMDDYDGRAMAKEYNLKVIGTIGILLKAKLEGKTISLKHDLDVLRMNGFWLGEELYSKLITEANEAQ
jgi:predicted nucleic acid-binding protein